MNYHGIKIEAVEELYGVTHVGLYDLPDREGPFEVFYQPEPDIEKGHSHYMGVYRHPLSDNIYVTNAGSITEARFPALSMNGRWLVSRFRHNCVSEGPAMLDGGLAYTRCNPTHPPTHTMRIVDGQEVFEPREQKAA